MSNKESNPFILSGELKSQLSVILEKLSQPETAIFQALVAFYPEPVSTGFLQENTRLSEKEISRSISKISAVLHELSSLTIRGKIGYQLVPEEVPTSYFSIWSSLTANQRITFLSILTSKENQNLEPTHVKEINRKIQLVLGGSIRKNKEGKYSYFPSSKTSNQKLATDLVDYLAWEANLPKPVL